jgi:Ca-activated chloride channel family protein
VSGAIEAQRRFVANASHELRPPLTVMRTEAEVALDDAALDRLEARKGSDGALAPAAIVLLSDGKTTEGPAPTAAAERARKLGIPISTVALGTSEGVVAGPNGEPIAVPPDPETLAQIAETSRGAAFAAGDAGELDRVYERLGSRIGTRQEEREVSAAFAAGGLVLLLGGLGTGLRRRSVLA